MQIVVFDATAVSAQSNPVSQFSAATSEGSCDLQPTLLIVPDPAYARIPVEISYAVTNNGDSAAPGGWIDRIYLSDDDIVGFDSLLAEFVITDSLDPGESYSRTENISLPHLPEGDYWIIIETDADSNVIENGGESNNHLIAEHSTVLSHPTYLYGGTITTNTTWYSNNSPYIIFGDFVVRSRLTIEAGVTVFFSDSSGLHIGGTYYQHWGELVAIGTETDSIVFTSLSSSSNGWDGIYFHPYSDYYGHTSPMRYCVIEKAGQGGWGVPCGVRSANTIQPAMSHCSIRDCGTYGLYLGTSYVTTISSTVFSGNKYGLYCGNSSPAIQNCSFIDNTSSGIYLGGNSYPDLTANTYSYSSNSHGITVPGHTKTGSGTWYDDDEPYVVLGDIFLEESSLTIEPGVEIQFADNAGVHVGGTYYKDWGNLAAVGTETDSIVFTSLSGSSNGWDGIYFHPYSDYRGHTSPMRYCVIEKAGQGGWGASYGVGSANTIQPAMGHCSIRDCGTYGFYLGTSYITAISSTVFSGNTYGLYCGNSSPIIRSCTFTENTNSGIVLGGNSRPDIGNSSAYSCDLYQNGLYEIRNNTVNTINARYNYWGTGDLDLIADNIFDHADDPSKGSVLIMPIVWEHSIAITEILAPSGVIPLGSPVVPQVVIMNNGRNVESGMISLDICGVGYTDAVSFDLESGDQDTISFASWTPIENAAHRITCTVDVADDNASDNVATQLVSVSSGFGPEIHGIVPTIGVTNLMADILVIGERFEEGMTARLTLAGEPNIETDTISSVTDTSMTLSFNLMGAAVDLWNLEVTDTSGDSYALYCGLEVIAFSGNLIPFCSWESVPVHDGSTMELAVDVPAVDDLFILVKKGNRQGFGGSWLSAINVFSCNSIVAEAVGQEDIAIHLKNPSTGMHEVEIYAYDPGEAELRVCSALDVVNLGEWYVGEILRPYGYDWVQFDVPEGQSELYIQTEGFGMWSTIDVYYESLSDPTEQWHFRNWGAGYHIEGEIPNPPAGRYYLRYMDSAVLYGGTSGQRREYMLFVDTEPIITDPPMKPTITGLSTYTGGQGPVTIEIYGSGLDSLSTVVLRRDDYNDEVAKRVIGNSDRQKLLVTFDLTNTERGEWQVVVTNPDGCNYANERKFRIEAGGKPQVEIDIVGRSVLRTGRQSTFWVTLENSGNLDTGPGILSINVMDWDMPVSAKMAGAQDWLYPIITPITIHIPFIPCGGPGTRQRVDIVAPKITLCGVAAVGYYGRPPDAGDGDPDDDLCDEMQRVFRSMELERDEEIQVANDMVSQMLSLALQMTAPGLSETQKQQIRSEILVIQKFHTIQLNYLEAMNAELKRQERIIEELCEWKDVSIQPHEYEISRSGLSHLNFCTVGSSTPEDKVGPQGHIPWGNDNSPSKRFVNIPESFPYRIDFWNHDTATAPAQIVFVEDTIDTDFDLTTFGFDEIGFLRWSISLDGTQYFNVDVDMRPDMDLIVNVEGTLDPDNRVVKWAFRSLDPETGELPEDPMAGFLPPMDSTGYYIGWVDFSIDPHPYLPTGTRLTNQAWVNFDSVASNPETFYNPAPKEGPWINTLDVGPPSSQVLALSDTLYVPEFTVNWDGADDAGGAGLRSYSVYYNVDGGIFEPWLTDTTDTAGLFIGEHGHAYSFYSIATDNVGHIEEPPDSFDTRTTVVRCFTSTSGYVIADSAHGLLGVNVDIYDDQGELWQSLVTDDSGYFHLDSIMAGPYSFTVETPLGYYTDEETKSITVSCDPHALDFHVSQLDIVPHQRSRAYWARQICLALRKKRDDDDPKNHEFTEFFKPGQVTSSGDYTKKEFAEFTGLIDKHFCKNAIYPVQTYAVPQRATVDDSLRIMKNTLVLLKSIGGSSHELLARGNLVALMLNSVSKKISPAEIITEDSMTVSQAIVYCDMLIHNVECPVGNIPDWYLPDYERNESTDRFAMAGFVAGCINSGMMLPGGSIPEDIADIAFRYMQQTAAIPGVFSLSQNYPNPFNPNTQIEFGLPEDCHVRIEIYNILGQKVKTLMNQSLHAGYHSVIWDSKNEHGREVATGIYFYRITAAEFVESKKMLLLK